MNHEIRTGRLSSWPKANEAIRELQHPTSMTDVKNILGYCNVFWQIIPDYESVDV